MLILSAIPHFIFHHTSVSFRNLIVFSTSQFFPISIPLSPWILDLFLLSLHWGQFCRQFLYVLLLVFGFHMLHFCKLVVVHFLTSDVRGLVWNFQSVYLCLINFNLIYKLLTAEIFFYVSLKCIVIVYHFCSIIIVHHKMYYLMYNLHIKV